MSVLGSGGYCGVLLTKATVFSNFQVCCEALVCVLIDEIVCVKKMLTVADEEEIKRNKKDRSHSFESECEGQGSLGDENRKKEKNICMKHK